MGINSWSTLHRVVARKHKFWFWAARCRGDQLGEGTKVKIRTKTLFIYYKLVVKSLGRVRLFVIPWTVACQAPLSMEFSRQEYSSGLPSPSPGESFWPSDQTHVSCVSCIAGRFFTHWAIGEAQICQVSSDIQSCPTLCDSMDCSMPGLPCPSPTPGIYSDSCPLRPWCHPTI